MRSTKPEVIKDGSVIVGVALPGNFCAEHECGIKTLSEKLGLGKLDGFGIPRRTVTNIEWVSSCKWDHFRSIEFGVYRMVERESDDWEDRFVEEFGATELANLADGSSAEWDDRSARVVASKDDADLYEAVSVLAEHRDRIAVLPSGTMMDHVFGKGGICFVRTDLVSPATTWNIARKDSEAHRLQTEWEPVKKMLEELRDNWVPTELHMRFVGRDYTGEYRLRWMYLGPNRFEIYPIEGSKYPFRLWLNPEDQRVYNSGWYTVEEIAEWIVKGTGPVVEGGYAHRLLKAFKEWEGKGHTDLVPDYHGICSECGTLLYFGNGPFREAKVFEPYPARESDAPGTCPNCGADHSKFVLSPHQRSDEYAQSEMNRW